MKKPVRMTDELVSTRQVIVNMIDRVNALYDCPSKDDLILDMRAVWGEFMQYEAAGKKYRPWLGDIERELIDIENLHARLRAAGSSMPCNDKV